MAACVDILGWAPRTSTRVTPSRRKPPPEAAEEYTEYTMYTDPDTGGSPQLTPEGSEVEDS
eukprot:6450140-Prorocentrum_lima.AAC.1